MNDDKSNENGEVLELLTVLQENYADDFYKYRRVVMIIQTIIAFGIIGNCMFYIPRGEYWNFFINVVPVTLIFLAFLFALSRKYKPKYPTVEDAQKWFLQKQKMRIAIPLEDTRESYLTVTCDQTDSEIIQDERPLIGTINKISTTSISRLNVLKGLPERIVVTSTSQREVDRVTTNIVNGVLYIHRIPLIMGNMTFHSHVKNIIDTNCDQIVINMDSATADLDICDDYVDVYLENPDAITIEHN